jgi:hypothetical protein
MNIVEEFRQEPDRVLDRLVDGELGQAERRQLLIALDDEPGAWRSCALAFLESQSFRWQLTRLAASATLAAERERRDTAQSASSLGAARLWGLCLAAAAGLLVAFGLGTRFARPALAPGVAPDSQVAAAVTEPAINLAAEAAPIAAADSNTSSIPSTVTLARTGDESGSGNIELPVAEADLDGSQWLQELDTGVPASLYRRLREAGLDVVRRQQLYNVDLSDGRQLVVPVEQVEIRHSDSTESF